MKEFNVGLISYDFYPPLGGQGVEAFNLYKHLKKHPAVDVKVMSSSSIVSEDHLRVHVFSKGGLAPIEFSLKINMSIGRIGSSTRVNIFQVYGGPGGVQIIRKPSAPLLYVANHTYAQQEKYLGGKLYKPMKRIESRGYLLADAIVAISSSTKESLINDYQIDPNKISVIPVGIDPSFFRPVQEEELKNSVLFVGRLCRRKSVDVLIRACKRIVSDIPDLKLFIVGVGEEYKNLNILVHKLNLAENVKFLGKISNEELIRLYNRVSLFCLPSVFEGFGIVCAEAMACGLPVVASNVPGIKDVFPKEYSQYLFEAGNHEDLAAKICMFLNNDSLRSEIGHCLRHVAEERYDWSKIANSYIEQYLLLLRNHEL